MGINFLGNVGLAAIEIGAVGAPAQHDQGRSLGVVDQVLEQHRRVERTALGPTEPTMVVDEHAVAGLQEAVEQLIGPFEALRGHTVHEQYRHRSAVADFLGPDASTGTFDHAAAALGTPVVAHFGPTHPERTGPRGLGHFVVQASRPADHHAFRRDPQRVHMGALDVDRVADAVLATLGAAAANATVAPPAGPR